MLYQLIVAASAKGELTVFKVCALAWEYDAVVEQSRNQSRDKKDLMASILKRLNHTLPVNTDD